MIRDSMKVSIIVAIDDKKGIGRSSNSENKGMLWHISEDFKRFKALTSGHPIIMGRKTHEMIGRVLPNRTNIIITRDPDYNVEGAIIVDSLEKAIEAAKKVEESRIINQESRGKNDIHDSKLMIHNSDENEIFIIGGGQIFAQGLPLANKLYVTLVKGDFGADVFFPEYEKDFPIIESEETKSDGEYMYTFQNRLQKAK